VCRFQAIVIRSGEAQPALAGVEAS
jgi:hypothetical protein